MVPLDPWRKTGALISLTIFALTGWVFLYLVLFSAVQHARSQHELYSTLRAELALATAPVGGVIAPGSPVAVLTIPAAQLRNEVVVEGTTSGVTRSGPGHLRTTPLPGQPGVAVLFGRSKTFGGPFAHIGSLHAGDPITVTTDQGVFRFTVSGVRHAGDPLPDAVAAGGGRLTLVASEGGWTADKVVYVDATLQGKAAADPGGRINVLSPSEKLMAGETDPLTFCEIFLWLQLLVVLAFGVPWLRHKWGYWQIWLVGTPALAAVIWGASSTAVRLLPNLL
jgi:sortase A